MSAGGIRRLPILFDSNEKCCGCGACVSTCNRGAISMVTDEFGFVYPWIDTTNCIECGACTQVCGYQKIPLKHVPYRCYAASAKDEDVLKRSSSGGAFSVLAKEYLKNGGIVYGAALKIDSNTIETRHLRIDTIEQLHLLQGSKYVQSSLDRTYKQVREDLMADREVLFSGTPCQIAALKAYLKKEYRNLLTAEVICHGVPSVKMFRDFLRNHETRQGDSVLDFTFRVKALGQGINSSVSYRDQSGRVSHILKNGHLYSYIHFFLTGEIYRDSCYSCPFTTKERCADVTLGDYWGFHEEHPEISSADMNNSRGVSCLLVNTQKGLDIINRCHNDMVMIDTSFSKIVAHNGQLKTPSQHSEKRQIILKKYRDEGYEAVEQYYRTRYVKERIKYTVVSLVPKGIKRTIKRVCGFIRQNHRS